jgi:ketosteroid isomerase-like protein
VPLDVEAQIRELIDRETRAWNARDVDLLLSVFHEDMVWPWPPDSAAHDPAQWILVWGRYDRDRWRRGWQELFDSHELVHNRRSIVRIAISTEGDGAFAVVDVDTLWRRSDGVPNHWSGRACKFYALTARGWRMTAQTGLLDYSLVVNART